MKSNAGPLLRPLLGLIVLASIFTGPLSSPPALAQDASQSCDVPDYLLESESALPKVAQAIKDNNALNILVIGSRSSTIPASETSGYPYRLQAFLKEQLPSLAITVSQEIQPKKSAEEVGSSLAALVETKKPTLVIWQTGTVDAIRSVDPDDFRGAVDEGVAALQGTGTDVVLMNLQYSPRTETMTSAPPYLDNMRVVAQQHDVPLFDRFAIMRQWNDAGDFDLFSTTRGLDLAKRVHDCLGRALSKFLIAAAHAKPSQQN